MYERAVFAEQAEAPVVQECALPACLHQGDSCAVAVIDPSATIDLRNIHELMMLAEQAKQAMAMLRGAGDLKRVQREWDALEDRSFCMAEDAPDDEGPNVDVGVKDKDKENVHGNDNGNNHSDDDQDGGAGPASEVLSAASARSLGLGVYGAVIAPGRGLYTFSARRSRRPFR